MQSHWGLQYVNNFICYTYVNYYKDIKMKDTKVVAVDHGVTSEAKKGLPKALKGKDVKVGKVTPKPAMPVSAFMGLKEVKK